MFYAFIFYFNLELDITVVFLFQGKTTGKTNHPLFGEVRIFQTLNIKYAHKFKQP